MKVKLQSGREIVIEDLSVDERDELMDSVVHNENKDGSYGSLKNPNATMTKFIRAGIKKADDKFIKSLTWEEKAEIYQIMQGEYLNLGEEKASK